MASPRKKPRTKTERKRAARKSTLPASLRRIVENPESIKPGRPSDYTPEACNIVEALMGEGLSLTAAAGAMGIARSTIHEWIKEHPEFSDSVARGKTARVFKLETDMLGSDQGPVVNARRFALVNAAPEEWREKVEVETPPDDPIRLFAQQLMGTAIRPQLPAPRVVEHDPHEQPRTIRPRPQAKADIIDVEATDVTPAAPVASAVTIKRAAERLIELEAEDEDDAPRIHTVSKNYREDSDDGEEA